MKITFDFRDFERAARSMDGLIDQVPYALARSLNEAADTTRQHLIQETWPQHVHVRSTGFMSRALTTSGKRANKRNLSVEIYDRLGRANLKLHDSGGYKRPRGSKLAVPSKSNLRPRLGSHGMPAGLRPRALPNSFEKGGVIYKRIGTYKKGKKGVKGKDDRRLKAMYRLVPQISIPGDVPFEKDFERIMRREVPRVFGKNFEIAMRTAFR